jgi:hypothetical protein
MQGKFKIAWEAAEASLAAASSIKDQAFGREVLARNAGAFVFGVLADSFYVTAGRAPAPRLLDGEGSASAKLPRDRKACVHKDDAGY